LGPLGGDGPGTLTQKKGPKQRISGEGGNRGFFRENYTKNPLGALGFPKTKGGGGKFSGAQKRCEKHILGGGGEKKKEQ